MQYLLEPQPVSRINVVYRTLITLAQSLPDAAAASARDLLASFHVQLVDAIRGITVDGASPAWRPQPVIIALRYLGSIVLPCPLSLV